MTKFEKIKNMSVEKMAELYSKICENATDCDYCPFKDDCPNNERKKAWVEWLNSEVTE